MGKKSLDGRKTGRGTTELLARMGEGHVEARDQVFQRLYDELHRIASRIAHKRLAGQTLEATDLIGEAYHRLARVRSKPWESRAHFLNTAAAAMRQVLVDHVRLRRAEKRGGRLRRSSVALDALARACEERTGGLVAFDEELKVLERADPVAARVVSLRFFAGLSVDATAEVLDLSVRRVEREWTYARAWLRQHIDKRAQ